MAQLATCAALVPYYPKMPIPTLASMIMLTSLAPSPTASVSLPISLTNLTIYAFCPGVTLQKTTDFDFYMTQERSYWFQTKERVEPSMTGLALTQIMASQWVSMYLTNCYRSLTPLMRQPYSMSLQESAMFSAVSNLSPVSMTTLIPPSLREQMVSGTKSCSLSSIPVAPTRI